MYPKDTEKWKQFTTKKNDSLNRRLLLCIPKILKNESNSQPKELALIDEQGCCVSQRYWKMKAIHNPNQLLTSHLVVVVYPKDTEKWKQFTTKIWIYYHLYRLLCIPKILKNESNSQRISILILLRFCCCVSQRYWKMKAIHNRATARATKR